MPRFPKRFIPFPCIFMRGWAFLSRERVCAESRFCASSVWGINAILEKNGGVHRYLSVIVTVLIIALVGIFVGRVVVLSNKIERGELVPLTPGNMTISPRLSRVIASGDGEEIYDVASKDDPSIGPADAELTIVEFADFGCPYSEEASSAIRALSLTYGDRIRYVYRDFPITDLHPDAALAAEASGCANDQKKFWAFHDMLYQNQDDLSRASLREYARSVGLDVPRFDQCVFAGTHRNEVLADMQDGIDAGVVGTPTFFFNGRRVEGAIPLKTLEQIVDAFLSS